MSGNRQKTGKDGEQKALSYIIKKKYQIVETNWRHQKCEIDIIASKNKELVFIEVKTRTFPYFGDPQIAVTEKKQESIYTLASEYMHRIEHEGEIRFDIISITMQPEQKITHYTDAFFPTW